jgi:hypothetical protein
MIPFLVSASLALVSQAQASAQDGPQLIEVQPEHVFAPTGFDDNDNSQVVLAGEFASTCYKVAPPEIAIDAERREVRVRAHAWYYPEGDCLRVVTPWTRTLDLGILAEGAYRVLVQQEGRDPRPMAELAVARSHGRGPDDHLYAHVTDAVVRGNEPKGSSTLTLYGTFQSNCLRFTDVLTIQRAPDVIEILPIVEWRSDIPCGLVYVPIRFERVVAIKPRQAGTALIHVRSVQGESVNRVVEFY